MVLVIVCTEIDVRFLIFPHSIVGQVVALQNRKGGLKPPVRAHRYYRRIQSPSCDECIQWETLSFAVSRIDGILVGITFRWHELCITHELHDG